MKTVQIEIDAEGFEYLWSNAMHWRGIDWFKQASRFTPEPVNFDWKFVYWFDKYTDLVLAEGFLKAIRAPFNRHSDEVEGWIILTDFGSPCFMGK
jgi:hypothetical protein